ncbi:unnamed protein product [Caenorhabditis angaria]|uniref:Cationic amino acid transporter C-terminal domain-containing protein n=1 Tax=Caenorhabditis angaria TaxID=860376 RepID=A0A9P1IA69_9PELO|nr:unnamed protein product [Caenorhabditis angaria]
MTIWTSLFRRKQFRGDTHLTSELKRCLNVFDVMFIAVGHMIGAGIYVLTGQVVHSEAGPAIIISFLLSGFAALLSAFSYAEFGARFPRAGSAYTYSYVAMGEIWGFIVGWTVPLEYMIGLAAVARAWTAYLDNLVNKRISTFIIDNIGHLSTTEGGFFAKYPDFVAFILLILVSIAVAIGSKFSANLNSSFVTLNIAVIIFVVIYGLTFADFSLWSGIDEFGRDRFMPYGWAGVIQGAASCFFAFIGFEALSTAGEEARNPHRTIPLATFGSLSIIIVLYVAMGSSLTLMIPYNQVDPEAAFSAAFEAKGATVAKIIMSIGALAGMLNNLVTGAFALPRSVYAMADDGLIFGFFAKVNSKTKTPLNATIVFTLLTAILTLIFDLNALVEFLSIGTLLAYSMVSACVLLLRYQAEPLEEESQHKDNGGQLKSWVPFKAYISKLPAGYSIKLAVFSLIFGYVIIALTVRLQILDNIGGIVLLAVGVILSLSSLILIIGHEENQAKATYKVPFVPFIPALGLICNVFMMIYLKFMTWIRFIVWLAIGLFIYFGYGIRHSKEARSVKIENSKPEQK